MQYFIIATRTAGGKTMVTSGDPRDERWGLSSARWKRGKMDHFGGKGGSAADIVQETELRHGD